VAAKDTPVTSGTVNGNEITVRICDLNRKYLEKCQWAMQQVSLERSY